MSNVRTCKVVDCVSLIGSKGARGMCPLHYQRELRGVAVVGRSCPTCSAPIATGFHNSGTKYCSDECKPRCSVAMCTSPVRKRGWCASHYAQARRTGRDPVSFTYKWAERAPCVVCGQPSAPLFRQFCSGACAFRWRKYDGKPPTATSCAGCGVSIDLTVRGKGGQRKKASTKLCKRCKGEYAKYSLTVHQLAERDGTDCGICGKPVDLSLRRSESFMCASVDHIVPRALGGGHEPENLQLAHLSCNQVKSDLRGRVPASVKGGG